MTPGINVELNLDEIVFGNDPESGLRSKSLSDMILELAASELVRTLGREQTDRIRQALFEERQRQISAAVAPMIEEAITASVQPTDGWGQPKGEPITLREVITSEATKYLTEPRSDRYGAERMTPVQRIIREEVERTVKSELQKAMKAAQEDVAEAVRAQGAVIIAETITRLAGAKIS